MAHKDHYSRQRADWFDPAGQSNPAGQAADSLALLSLAAFADTISSAPAAAEQVQHLQPYSGVASDGQSWAWL